MTRNMLENKAHFGYTMPPMQKCMGNIRDFRPRFSVGLPLPTRRPTRVVVIPDREVGV